MSQKKSFCLVPPRTSGYGRYRQAAGAMLDDYAARETKWQSYEKVGDRRAVAVTSGPVPPVEMLWRSDKNRFEAVTHPSGTERFYGAGGEEMATSSLHEPMECRDAPAERLEQIPRRPGRE